MKITIVYPNNDSRVHVVSKDEKCWCDPQVLEEGIQSDGSHIAETHIHKPIDPVIEGHKLDLKKVELN